MTLVALVVPARAQAAAADEKLGTTRWHIASHLYLLNWGRYDRAASEANIAHAAKLGFNAIRFNIWWHEIFPDAAAVAGGGNWEPLDHNVEFASRQGLKVILTVCLRRPADGLYYGPGDCVLDSDGQADKNWDKTTRMSFASPRFGRAIRFFQQVGQRYRDKHNGGHVLAIAPLVTREAEIAYAHEKYEDYHPAFVGEFRAWLAGRYDRQIAGLNAVWGKSFDSFDRVSPPAGFAGPAGQDWYRFRDLKARQFVDSCCAALGAIEGLKSPYRVLLDYGNVGDPMAWRRGSLSFPFHAANPMVWAVKHNDAHDYDQRYSGSLLRANAQHLGKLAFNEWFYDADPARYPRRDVIGDSCREIQGHFDQGMNGVSYVNVKPGNADLAAVVARLKETGVWDAPVTKRKPDPGSVANVKLSALLELRDWQIKERYFEPQWRKGTAWVDVIIERDLADPLLPIIRPE